MTGRLRVAVLLVLASLAAPGSVTACASASHRGGTSGAAAPRRSSSDEITAAEIDAARFSNVLDLVTSLRPQWLSAHGHEGLVRDDVGVQVRVDDTRLGGAETLRTMSVTAVRSLRYVDPIAAAARWGAGYKNGAIVISTRE